MIVFDEVQKVLPGTLEVINTLDTFYLTPVLSLVVDCVQQRIFNFHTIATQVLMPALESRGSISRTQYVPINSASGYSTSSTSSAQALLTSTATAAVDMVQYVNKNLFAVSTSKEQSSGKTPPTAGTSNQARREFLL